VRRPLILFACLVVLPLALVVGAGAVAYHHVAMAVPPRLGDQARAAAMAPLRAALEGREPARPRHAELERQGPGSGLVVVSLWAAGRRVVRVEGSGLTTADAILGAARELSGAMRGLALDTSARDAARLQVDVVTGHTPLVRRWQATTALGVIPGIDGLGVRVAHRDVALMPDELVSERLLGAMTPLPLDTGFRVGLEFTRADAMLAEREYFRLRTDSFVERPLATRGQGAPLPLTRGLPPPPPLDADSLLAGARAGGEYLMAHVAADGRYIYEVDLTRGTASDPKSGAYSLPRHCGTSYYLAELYGVTRDPRVKDTLVKALDHLVALIDKGGCKGTAKTGAPFRCLVDRGAQKTNMGATALAVVAFAEFRLATEDPRYDQVIRDLAEWILDLRRDDGTFAHIYDVARLQPDWNQRLLYFDGEAALALIRAFRVTGDRRMIEAAGRALDATIAMYDPFVTKFFFSEEHWTCIAAEAGWPELSSDRYREFCSDYAAFLRQQQFDPDDPIEAQADLGGAYSLTPFFVPSNTPTGSRTEAMISAYLLGKYHGRPDPEIRRQVLAAMQYALRQQIRPDSDFASLARAPLGAVPSSSIDRNVRIDFVQHVCSAMLRSIELLGDEARE
jgi:hypothetical protein